VLQLYNTNGWTASISRPNNILDSKIVPEAACCNRQCSEHENHKDIWLLSSISWTGTQQVHTDMCDQGLPQSFLSQTHETHRSASPSSSQGAQFFPSAGNSRIPGCSHPWRQAYARCRIVSCAFSPCTGHSVPECMQCAAPPHLPVKGQSLQVFAS